MANCTTCCVPSGKHMSEMDLQKMFPKQFLEGEHEPFEQNFGILICFLGIMISRLPSLFFFYLKKKKGWKPWEKKKKKSFKVL